MKSPCRAVKAAVSLFAALSLSAMSLVAAAQNELPDRFLVSAGERFSLSHPLLSASPAAGAQSVATGENTVSYDVSLFGILPVKTVAVTKTERKTVTVSGQAFGIRLFSDGVMVVGLAELETENGGVSPGYRAGLRRGDVITSVNGKRITENAQLSEALKAANGESVTLRFSRNGKNYTASLTPAFSDGSFKAGLWVRDSVAGIGTLTYFDEKTGVFAGLGHGITDSDSGERYPLLTGNAVLAQVTGVKKGEVGAPGELKGYFSDTPVGELTKNTDEGVFGTVSSGFSVQGETLPVAFRQETEKGNATLYCDLGNGVTGYTVEVEKIRLNENATTRNMVIRVTDSRLLAATGGIVQGMSGSPLVQNGRLIGAVTHVFVDDPTRGYAIFAENMTDTAEGTFLAA